MWNTLYNQAPSHIKEFMQMIPPQDLEKKSVDQAVMYIKAKYDDYKKPQKNMIYDLGPSENAYKFTQSKDRVNINHSDRKTCDAQKMITPAVNFNSITLLRRSVLLDSRNRNLSKSSYSWDIVPFGSNTQGQINARESISQVIAITCSPFRIPIIPGQNMTYYKKIRMGISEFDVQGIEIISNSNYISRNYYHFDFTSQVDGNYLELTPVAPWYPSKIISMCDTISVNFYGNTEKIVMPNDRQQCTYTAGSPTTITSPEPHYLNTGDLVYCDGSLYNDQGYIVAVLSSTQFIIMLATTSPGTSNVYFASRRVQVRLDFICLSD